MNSLFTSHDFFAFTQNFRFRMYHTLLFTELNAVYYYSRLAIVLTHHYLADLVTNKYQIDNKTTSNKLPET